MPYSRQSYPVFTLAVFILVGLFLFTEPLWHSTSILFAQTQIHVDEANNGCTLIDAIRTANSGTSIGDCTIGAADPNGEYHIALETGAVYTFSEANNSTNGANALPSITAKLTIQGNNAIIERDSTFTCPDLSHPNFRLLHVASSGALTLESVTVRNGCATGSAAESRGGGIYALSTRLVLRDTQIVSNTAHGTNAESGWGGGIYLGSDSSTLEISASSILSNKAIGTTGGYSGWGGGIYKRGSGDTIITNSQIAHNSALGDTGSFNGFGGGFSYTGSGNVTIVDSHILTNTAYSAGPSGGLGGGTHQASNNDDDLVNLTIINTHILGNIAQGNGGSNSGRGGGVYRMGGGSMVVNDSRIEHNSAQNATGQGSGWGGGVFHTGTSLIITNTEVLNNMAQGLGNSGGRGGGLYLSSNNLAIIDSAIDHNTAQGSGSNSGLGGGAYLGSTGYLEITRSHFRSNTAHGEGGSSGHGGGIHRAGSGNMVITDSTIQRNITHGIGNSSGWGGGIYQSSGSLEISLSQVLSNTARGDGDASGWGGGIHQLGSSRVAVTASEIQGNTAVGSGSQTGWGGGVYQAGSGNLEIIDSQILSNTAQGGTGSISGRGGGISRRGSGSIAVANSSIQGNAAQGGTGPDSGWGGGIYQDDDNTGMATSYISQSLLISNMASTRGGALYQSNNYTTDITLSCIAGNSDIAVFRSGGTILARANWWGSADGPSGQGPGSGDSVSSQVDFNDWHTAPLAICPTLFTPTLLSIEKRVAPDGTLVPGQLITYTLRYTNAGETAAFGVIITDTLPTELTDVSFSADPPITDNGASLPYVWTADVLSPGESGLITLSARVAQTVTPPMSITNQAHIAAGNAASVASNSIQSTVELPLLQFSVPAYSADEATGSALVTVTLTPAHPVAAVTVRVATQDNSALAGIDYAAINENLVFAPGSISQTVAITIFDNDTVDGDRSLNLLLLDPQGATTGDPATLTILDDDEAGISIQGENLVVGEDGTTDAFTVTLQSRPTGSVTLRATPNDATACNAVPAEYLIAPASWDQPVVFAAAGINDDIAGGDRTCTLNVSTTSSDAHYSVPSAGTIDVLVVDDDVAGVVVEGDAPSYHIVLTSRPIAPVYFTLTAEDSNVCAVQPDRITIEPDAWQAGADFTVGAISLTDELLDCQILITATSEDLNYDAINIPPVLAGVRSQIPALSLSAGLAPASDPEPCVAAEPTLQVEAGSEVVFCVTAHNTGSASLVYHTLTDDLLGSVFSGMEMELLPGMSYTHQITQTVQVSHTHVLTWVSEAQLAVVDPEPDAQEQAAIAQAIAVSASAQVEVQISGSGNLPDPNQPDPNQPDPNQPDPNQPDPNQPDPNQPDPNQPDPNQPDPDAPGQGEPNLHHLFLPSVVQDR